MKVTSQNNEKLRNRYTLYAGFKPLHKRTIFRLDEGYEAATSDIYIVIFKKRVTFLKIN